MLTVFLSSGGRATAPFRWATLQVLAANLTSPDCGFNFDEATGNTTRLSDFICARGDLKASQDSCQGDSGGPLVCYDSLHSNHYLAGIMAFGPPCGLSIGAMFIKINSYMQWIISNTGADVQLE